MPSPTVTNILENSKVIIPVALGSPLPLCLRSSALANSGPAEALVDHVTAQFRHQGQLLEETNRDLAAHKKALCNAERDMRDLAEKFEQEKQALNDEIRQLREYGMHDREERFEQALNDGILQLKVRLPPCSMRDHLRMLRVLPLQVVFLRGDRAVLMVVFFTFHSGDYDSRKTNNISAESPTSTRQCPTACHGARGYPNRVAHFPAF